MDQETVEQFEDRVLNKRAAKVCIKKMSLSRILFNLRCTSLSLSIFSSTSE